MQPILKLAFLFALSSTPALAASGSPGIHASQDTLLFSGTVRGELAPEHTRIFSLPANMLEDELARIRLSLLSSGEHEKAIEETRAIWVRLARTPNRGGAGPLARGVAMRAWVLSEAGRTEEARVALRTPLPSLREFRRFYEVSTYRGSDLDPDSAFQSKLAEAIAADPAVVAMRKELEGVSGEENTFVASCRARMSEQSYRYLEENFGLPTDEIAELALKALRRVGSFSAVKKLGSQATAVLAFVALADPDAGGFTGVGASLSEYSALGFMHVDRVRALRLFTEFFDEGGVVWRSRILDACKQVEGLDSRASWVPFPPPMADQERIGGRPWNPEWFPLLERLLSDEVTREESIALVDHCAFWDGFTPGLQEALGRCIRSDRRSLAVKVLAVVSDSPARVPSAFPVYVAGLASPFPDIRRSCAWRLSEAHAVEELLPFARDPDPEVRRAVARVLAPARLRLRRGGLQLDSVSNREFERTALTSDMVPVIETLLADEEESVREEMQDALPRMDVRSEMLPELLESPLPRLRGRVARELGKRRSLLSTDPPLVRRVLEDPDPLVRTTLINSLEERSVLWNEALSVLAMDEDPGVLEALDGNLRSPRRFRRQEYRKAAIAALPIRLANGAVPFEPHGGGAAGWLNFAAGNRITFSEVPFLLALALERGYDEPVAHQLDSLIVTPDPPPAQAPSLLGTWPGITLSKVDRFPDACLLRELEPPVRRVLYAWRDAVHEIGTHQQRKLRKELIERAMLQCGGPDDEVALLAIEAGEVGHSWVRKILSTRPRETSAGRELRRRVFLSTAAPLKLRLAAGAGSDVLAWPEGERALDSLLEAAAREDALYELGRVAQRSTRGNEYLLRVMSENRLTGAPLLIFLEAAFEGSVGNPGTDQLAIAILDRYLEAPGEWNGAVDQALGYLGEVLLVYEHPGYVLTAARDPRYVEEAIGVMSERRLPEFVEPLCGMFENDWPALTAENVDSVRYDSAQALAEYGGREVMDFLSGIVFEVGGDVRERVVESLENLRRYEELRATWRTSPLPPREEALVELVEMLDSERPPIRAAAARGLAAFGAIEAIPRLIRLLEDDSEVVRAAAEQALEQLFENPPDAAGSEEESSGESDG